MVNVEINILVKHSINEISSIRSKFNTFKSNLRKKIVHKLFPREYPYSVDKGYKGFSNFTFLSNVCFNTMNFLTTQVLINSLNLNISRATSYAFSAGMNWAIKEGAGQMGKINLF